MTAQANADSNSDLNSGSILNWCGETTPLDRRNLKSMLWFLLLWAITFTGASQLLKRGILETGNTATLRAQVAAWTVAVLPGLAAALVIWTYARYLNQADELQRKIHLTALAFSFGITFFSIGCYQVLERAGAPAAAPGDFIFVMAITFAASAVYGSLRYR